MSNPRVVIITGAAGGVGRAMLAEFAGRGDLLIGVDVAQSGLAEAVKALGERRAILLGLAWAVLGFVIYGMADVGWLFLVGLPISALWAIAAPGTQSLISKQVGPEAQGRIQGALSGLISLAGIFAPALFAGSFGFFIGPHAPVRLPGIAFLIAAVLLACAVVVGWRYARPARIAAPGSDAVETA